MFTGKWPRVAKSLRPYNLEDKVGVKTNWKEVKEDRVDSEILHINFSAVELLKGRFKNKKL